MVDFFRRARTFTAKKVLTALLVLAIGAVGVVVASRNTQTRPAPAPRPFIEPVSERVAAGLQRSRGRPSQQPEGLTAERPDPGSEASAAVARGRSFVAGRVLVRFRPGTSDAAKARIRDELEARLIRRLPIPDTELLSLPAGMEVEQARDALSRNAEVAYAEPDFVYSASALTPNDPRFTSLWGLQNAGNTDMDAPEAWSVTTGSKAVRVGVVDTGVAYDHPDLSPNIATNPGETGGGKESNGKDDDGNGYIDDYRGWDWVGRDNDARDLHGHGSHVAGTIGAKGNNGVAVSGVNWDVGLVPLRVLDADGSGTSSSIASAFAYAGAMGIDVVNASLGGPSTSQSVLDAINRSPNTLFVAAAGNESVNNDSVASYPCNLQASNIVCVAALTQSDGLASFSNYGATTVDIGAPGAGILSTVPVSLVPVTDGFESGFGERWSAAGTGVGWGLAADSFGSYLADSPGGNYTPSSDSMVRTVQPVDLSNAAGCRLRQALRLDTEQGSDVLVAEASRDATTWTRIGAWSGTTGGRWSETSADLGSFAGASSVYLRYRLISNSNDVVGAGADLDDLAVRCVGTSYTGDEVATYSGTSMASPQVAGAAALVKAAVPGLDVASLKAALLDAAVPVSALQGKTLTGGRLNVSQSLQRAGVAVPATTTPVPSPTSVVTPAPVGGQTQTAPAAGGGVPPSPAPTAEPTPPPAAAPTPNPSPSGASPTPSPTGGDPLLPEPRTLHLTLKKHLVAKVSVSADGDACRSDVPIVVKRDGSPAGRARTDRSGLAKVRLPDRVGRYVAAVPSTSNCARAKDSGRHSHFVAATGSTSGDDQVAAASTAGSCYRFKASEKEFVTLMNSERTDRGGATLRLDPELSKVARVHTRDMVARDMLVHSTTQALTTRITGWSTLGENIGYSRDVTTMHGLFMGSPLHRGNILSRDFAHVGVGVVSTEEQMWVTVVFEGKSDPGTTLRMPSC